MSADAGTTESTERESRRFVISPMFIVLSVVALVLLVAGILGLTSPELVPALAKPMVAWSLIAVGLMLDGAAAVVLLASRRSARGR